MSSNKTKVSPEVIEAFLNGRNPKKYVVGVEATYNEPSVYLIVNDPAHGKTIEKHPYEPFLWFKHDVTSILYEGKRLKTLEAAQRFNVKIKKLQISDVDGNTPERLAHGYRYIATCKKSYNDLILFFKEGGIDVFDRAFSKMFFMFSPVEQFMIQTGIRLFKGMDDYDDLHRFQFDLETEGLFGSKDAIFQIGVRDNKGVEHVFETTGDTPQQRRDSERENIIKFFQTIDLLKPDIITGYNSESFDWKFIVDRCERLSLNLDHICIGLDGKPKFKRKPAMLKLGNEMEPFEQTFIFGHNIIDIAHSVRRAQAINSDIKAWGLKYITQYAGVAKKNRVYVPGNMIHTIWSDKVSQFAFNETNGDWYKISDRMGLKEGYQLVDGSFIVQRYLLDDLWETEQIDMIFNQAAFLISKILPTTYSRSSTMGTASQWKLIMAAWSFENGLGIPDTESKRDFTGGLSRLLKLGYSRNVVKLDYAALYPKSQLTHNIYPNLDISGVMEGMLTYVVDTRDKFKFLTGTHKDLAKKLDKQIKEMEAGTHDPVELEKLKEEHKKNKTLASLYDKKQLPLKILANSWFGAYGAPYIFNWGDSDCAEETTCRGRQYLRLMVKHFSEKYGFTALVGDTDGFNFAFPANIESVRYVATGNHWKTKENAGKELSGLEAVLAEFNETYMIGRMGLDIDDICNSTINFSRKNYANDIGGKIKLVGNSIKSKKMPVYIEDFLSKAIRMLLDGDGKTFVNFYYDYVDRIYNYNIPLVKIASKSKVKSTISDYKKKANKKNKAGNPMPKQAHMELALRNNLDITLGDTLYYVNTGKAKSHGDLKSVKQENGTTEIQLNCRLIDPQVVENDMEMIREMESLKKMLADTNKSNTQKVEELEAEIQKLETSLATEEYNVAKYLEAFNKKVKPLLVCFHSDIRDKILLSIKKDKKTKLEKLEDKNIFTDLQCQLVAGMPNKAEEQDTYEELMTMEDKEIKFWDKVNKLPNNMEAEEWERVRADYHVRKAIEREEGIEHEKQSLDSLFRHLEIEDIKKLEKSQIIPEEIIIIATVDEEGFFVSRKWEVSLCPIDDIFKYETEAIERNKWYQLSNNTAIDRYEQWMEYKNEQEIMNVSLCGATSNGVVYPPFCGTTNTEKTLQPSIEKIKEKVSKQESSLHLNKVVKKIEDVDDEDDEEEVEDEIDDFIPELQKAEFDIEIAVAKKVQQAEMLAEVADKLKGKILFPEKVAAAKEYLAKVKFPEPPIEKPKTKEGVKLKLDDDGWNF